MVTLEAEVGGGPGNRGGLWARPSGFEQFLRGGPNLGHGILWKQELVVDLGIGGLLGWAKWL